MILLTALTITGYALVHLEENKAWGEGVEAFNSSTWLTMVGSAIYSYEGIGVVLPLYEVTAVKTRFRFLLTLVMLTNLILFTGFGLLCLFIYGADELQDKPLITMSLPDTPAVHCLKAIFSINVIVSIAMCTYPANAIIESYTKTRHIFL